MLLKFLALFFLVGLPGTVWPESKSQSADERHFCERLQTNIFSVRLQALTTSSKHSDLMLIASDLVYRVPRKNLDPVADHLYMFHKQNARERRSTPPIEDDADVQGSTLTPPMTPSLTPLLNSSTYTTPEPRPSSTKPQVVGVPGRMLSGTFWYDHEKMQLFEIYQHKADNLRWYSLLEDGRTGKLYSYYEVEDTYYILGQPQSPANSWHDYYDPSVWPMEWRAGNFWHAPGGALIWGFVNMDNGLHRSLNRVAVTRMVIKHNDDGGSGSSQEQPATASSTAQEEYVDLGGRVSINFPSKCTADFEPRPLPTPYYFMETNENRSRLFLRSPAAEPLRLSYRRDLFVVPPFVLITQHRVYMFDVPSGRVYVVDVQRLLEALRSGPNVTLHSEIELKLLSSKSWHAFFQCNPLLNITDPSGEPEQWKYIQRVERKLGWNQYPRLWTVIVSIICAVMLLGCMFTFGMVYISGGFKRESTTERRKQQQIEAARFLSSILGRSIRRSVRQQQAQRSASRSHSKRAVKRQTKAVKVQQQRNSSGGLQPSTSGLKMAAQQGTNKAATHANKRLNPSAEDFHALSKLRK